MFSSKNFIEVQDLRKTYGRGSAATKALRGVSFAIDSGEWVSIVGTSGSGKTTLLNVLGALDAHYEGQITIGGQELKKLGDRALSRFRSGTIGFVFQSFNLLPHLTVLDNVMLPALFSSSKSNQNNAPRIDTARKPEPTGRERGLDLIQRVGLEGRDNARPTELSGGEQQRVAVARALFNNTQLLLCDEPTGALDSTTGNQVMELFASLNREEGITLIVVTHEEYISEMADRVIRFDDGLIVSDEVIRTDKEAAEKP